MRWNGAHRLICDFMIGKVLFLSSVCCMLLVELRGLDVAFKLFLRGVTIDCIGFEVLWHLRRYAFG